MQTNLNFVNHDQVETHLHQTINRFPMLSTRERECLFYLLTGKTAKQIAKICGISNRTVETHICKIKDKLGANNKAELFLYFLKASFF